MSKKLHNRKYLLEARRSLRLRETVQEKRLWNLLKNKRLGIKFRRQHSIGPYIVDFYCATKKLIIEIDGAPHFKKERRIFDNRRTAFLEGLGFNVVRFSNNEIDSHISEVVKRISAIVNDTTFPSPD